MRLLVEFQLNFPSYSRSLLEMNYLVLKMFHRTLNYTWLFNYLSLGLPSVADSYLDTFSAFASPRISFNFHVFFNRAKILYVDSEIVNIQFIFIRDFGIGRRRREQFARA